MSKCLYLKCITEFFFFTICLTFQTNAMEVRFHFSHYIYYKLGVQFEHFSNGTRAHFNQHPSLPRRAEALLQCCLKAYTGEEITITLKCNSNRLHPVDFLPLSLSLSSFFISFSFLLSLYLLFSFPFYLLKLIPSSFHCHLPFCFPLSPFLSFISFLSFAKERTLSN